MKVSKKYLIWEIITVILAVAINAYIIMHSCLNASQSTEASKGIVDAFKDFVNLFSPNAINETNYSDFSNFIRKAVGHFGLFMVSGFLTTIATFMVIFPYKQDKYSLMIIISLAFGLAVAITTEIIQLNVPGRSGEIRDVFIDFAGYLVGFLLVFLIVYLMIRKVRTRKA